MIPSVETLALLVGVTTGAMFYLDGWVPSVVSSEFSKTKRYRGLISITSGGALGSLLDIFSSVSQELLTLYFVTGILIGLSGLLIICTTMIVIWRYTASKNKNTISHRCGRFCFLVLEALWQGVAGNSAMMAESVGQVRAIERAHGTDSENGLIESEMKSQDFVQGLKLRATGIEFADQIRLYFEASADPGIGEEAIDRIVRDILDGYASDKEKQASSPILQETKEDENLLQAYLRAQFGNGNSEEIV
jgi:hypothetical protein